MHGEGIGCHAGVEVRRRRRWLDLGLLQLVQLCLERLQWIGFLLREVLLLGGLRFLCQDAVGRLRATASSFDFLLSWLGVSFGGLGRLRQRLALLIWLGHRSRDLLLQRLRWLLDLALLLRFFRSSGQFRIRCELLWGFSLFVRLRDRLLLGFLGYLGLLRLFRFDLLLLQRFRNLCAGGGGCWFTKFIRACFLFRFRN